MLPSLPRRLIGYGAYNLCFDNQLGRPATAGPDFFHAIRQRAPFVNLVKVIAYRNSGIEGLNGFPDRRVPLYTPAREINDAFLTNLRRLVDAADAVSTPDNKFFVQVCIFSWHSVANLKDKNMNYTPIPPEQPENVPRELVPPPPPPPAMPNPIDNARWFFAPELDARTHKQKELVARLGQTLAGRANVIWELVNEVRVRDDTGHDDDNQRVAAWLNQMRDALRSNAGADINVTASTAVNNETLTLRQVPLTVFDFHSGQWEMQDHYQTGIPRAKQRAATYNPNAPLIINDDGIDMPRNQPNVTGWATVAFQNGLHYSTKASYPPAEDFAPQQIAALRAANDNVP